MVGATQQLSRSRNMADDYEQLSIANRQLGDDGALKKKP
jgi:hypothetical protein